MIAIISIEYDIKRPLTYNHVQVVYNDSVATFYSGDIKRDLDIARKYALDCVGEIEELIYNASSVCCYHYDRNLPLDT